MCVCVQCPALRLLSHEKTEHHLTSWKNTTDYIDPSVAHMDTRNCVYVCVCVCVCVCTLYIHIYIYTRMHARTHAHTHTHTRTHTHTHTLTHSLTHSLTHLLTHTHTHTKIGELGSYPLLLQYITIPAR